MWHALGCGMQSQKALQAAGTVGMSGHPGCQALGSPCKATLGMCDFTFRGDEGSKGVTVDGRSKAALKALLISTSNLQPSWLLSPAARTQAEDDLVLRLCLGAQRQILDIYRLQTASLGLCWRSRKWPLGFVIRRRGLLLAVLQKNTAN